ncbi:GNAT family N-acetyltransferase [Candidatus Chloroploca sp. M-50]|uniref:GNAT family N-acetyltransferase n=1 Tax=Candidatus Chloroploca mongolica TaxID=2528176 RepID=A0ABS4DEV6_9CHLR|nr:GNAT family N-acetyltransferase [Candidatus Chloroploca mongolica]MBP1467972.1 GNAT family N-acetyltransferase [Candidatus Chloroploca mongolica]
MTRTLSAHSWAFRLAVATEEDFADVARLFAALHTFNASLDPCFALAEGWQALLHEHFVRTHNAPGSLWLLAWVDAAADDPPHSEPVGLLLMESHLDSPLFAQRRWAELVALYVDERARGTDLAQQLVNASTAWAAEHGFDRVQLYVTASNERARAFYTRAGFALAQEIWRLEVQPLPDVTPPPEPTDHMHPELGHHHLAIDLDRD